LSIDDEPPRRIQRLSSALQAEIEAQLNAGMPRPEVAAILTDLAIRYAQDDHATAYATLATMAETAREAIKKTRS
jgi:hypothetical protein